MTGSNGRTEIITGNNAAAIGVKLSGVEVIAAYPITPQTPVTEALSEFVESGELKAEYITVESEHSALSVVIAASTAGARTFTATSANGLAYMCEQIHWAAGSRLPVVMCVANRAMAAPWSVLNDQQDSMSQRDAGWIQIFCRNNQEILDTVIQAYRIAESLYIPVMVCYDGYLLSHTVMPVRIPEQKLVTQFLPPYEPHTILDPANPKNLNQVTLSDPRVNPDGTLCHGYMEFRYLLEEALEAAPETIARADREFGEHFGRSWGGLCWEYQLQDADVVLMAAGSITMEASVAVDKLRAEGVKAGVLGVRVYRPFPKDAVRKALKNARTVCVFDKSLSYGNEGPICADLKSALYDTELRPHVHGYIAGLGGRAHHAHQLCEAVRESLGWAANENTAKPTGWVNCSI